MSTQPIDYSTGNKPKPELGFDDLYTGVKGQYRGDGYKLAEVTVALGLQGLRAQDSKAAVFFAAKLMGSGMSKHLLYQILPHCVMRDMGTAHPHTMHMVLKAIDDWKAAAKEDAKSAQKLSTAWKNEAANKAIFKSIIALCGMGVNGELFNWLNLSYVFAKESFTGTPIWETTTPGHPSPTGWKAFDAVLSRIVALKPDAPYPKGSKPVLSDVITYRTRELLKWARLALTAMNHIESPSVAKSEWTKRWATVEKAYSDTKSIQSEWMQSAKTWALTHHDPFMKYLKPSNLARQYAWIGAVMGLSAEPTSCAEFKGYDIAHPDGGFTVDDNHPSVKYGLELLNPNKLAFSNRDQTIEEVSVCNFHHERGCGSTTSIIKLWELDESLKPTERADGHISLRDNKSTWARSAGVAPEKWLTETKKTSPCTPAFLEFSAVDRVDAELYTYSNNALNAAYRAIKEKTEPLASNKYTNYMPLVDNVVTLDYDLKWHEGLSKQFTAHFRFEKDYFSLAIPKRKDAKPRAKKSASKSDGDEEDDIKDLDPAPATDDTGNADEEDEAANRRLLEKKSKRKATGKVDPDDDDDVDTAAATAVPATKKKPEVDHKSAVAAVHPAVAAAAAAAVAAATHKRKTMEDEDFDAAALMAIAQCMTTEEWGGVTRSPVRERPSVDGIVVRYSGAVTFRGPYNVLKSDHLSILSRVVSFLMFRERFTKPLKFGLASEPGQLHRIWLTTVTGTARPQSEWTTVQHRPTEADPFVREVVAPNSLGLHALRLDQSDKWALSVLKELLIARVYTGKPLQYPVITRDFMLSETTGVVRVQFTPAVGASARPTKKPKRKASAETTTTWRDFPGCEVTDAEFDSMEKVMKSRPKEVLEMLNEFKEFNHPIIGRIEELVQSDVLSAATAVTVVATASSSSSSSAAAAASAAATTATVSSSSTTTLSDEDL